MRDLVKTTVSGDLDPVVRKRLAEVVQLLQVYARLAELEIAAGERPREGEGAKVREKEELVGELSQAMQAHGRDPTPIREAMGR